MENPNQSNNDSTNSPTPSGRGKQWAIAIVTLVTALGGVYAVGFGSGSDTTQAATPVAATQTSGATEITVYKSPTCGCCANWVDLLKEAGFKVNVSDRKNMNAVKNTYGVGRPLQSCHTAIVDGYVVEGHVPIGEIKRMLKERPQIAGIAVPGMPIGSPGMEMGSRKDPYDVLAFSKGGSTKVYARY